MNLVSFRVLPLLMLALALAGGCSPMVAQRGNMLEDYQVKQVIPGIHSRSDVLRIMGSPTTQAPFDDNVWYYLGQETEKKGIFDPKVTKQRTVVVAFDTAGMVQTIKDVDAGQVNIPIENAKTPTHGNDYTIMQQFLGNIGKFNTQKDTGPAGI